MFNIGSLILSLISSAGYGGLFLLSALESAAIPIPSEIVLPFSGFLAASGRFNLVAVVIVATVANLIGSLILYAIGRSGGRWLLEHYGRYVLIRWFARHGRASVFWGRVLPVVRTFISLPAGIAAMPAGTFSLFTVLGALPGNFALAYVGYKTGQHWDVLGPYFHAFDLVIGLLIVIAIIWYNGIYTPLKKKYALAVVPGSVIGAIPPAIGWVASGGYLFDITRSAVQERAVFGCELRCI